MKVLIGTPAYGGMITEGYFQSILNLKNHAYALGLDVSIMTLTNESLVTRARNEVVAAFMADDYTDLLFIDADIKFDAEHVLRILSAPFEVCATPYAMKGLNWDAVAADTSQDAEAAKKASIHSVINMTNDATIQDGFVTAIDAGTGFMRIQKSVINKMIEAYPETAYIADGVSSTGQQRWALFDTVIEDGRYLSEDYAFCRRWQALGGKVWVDVESSYLGHQGSYTYGR
jgi:hypothetical protein